LVERSSFRPVRALEVKRQKAKVKKVTLNVVKNATCTFCGCVCDDIELHADGERIVTGLALAMLLGAVLPRSVDEHRLMLRGGRFLRVRLRDMSGLAMFWEWQAGLAP